MLIIKEGKLLLKKVKKSEQSSIWNWVENAIVKSFQRRNINNYSKSYKKYMKKMDIIYILMRQNVSTLESNKDKKKKNCEC